MSRRGAARVSEAERRCARLSRRSERGSPPLREAERSRAGESASVPPAASPPEAASSPPRAGRGAAAALVASSPPKLTDHRRDHQQHARRERERRRGVAQPHAELRSRGRAESRPRRGGRGGSPRRAWAPAGRRAAAAPGRRARRARAPRSGPRARRRRPRARGSQDCSSRISRSLVSARCRRGPGVRDAHAEHVGDLRVVEAGVELERDQLAIAGGQGSQRGADGGAAKRALEPPRQGRARRLPARVTSGGAALARAAARRAPRCGRCRTATRARLPRRESKLLRLRKARSKASAVTSSAAPRSRSSVATYANTSSRARPVERVEVERACEPVRGKGHREVHAVTTTVSALHPPPPHPGRCGAVRKAADRS